VKLIKFVMDFAILGYVDRCIEETNHKTTVESMILLTSRRRYIVFDLQELL
jgi:hypothetical protein